MALVPEATLWMTFFMFIGAAIVAAVFAVGFIIIVIFTPAATFLKAKFKKMPIIAARRRDRKVDIHVADNYEQGLVTSDKYGSFIVDADSVYMDKKTGVPFLPVNSELGITLRESTLNMINGLKKMGIDNIEEAESLNAQYGICLCGYEGIMDFEKDNEGQPLIVEKQLKLICPLDKTKEEEHEESIKKEEKAGTDIQGTA